MYMAEIPLLITETVQNKILHVECKVQNVAKPFYKLSGRFKSNIHVNAREYFKLTDFWPVCTFIRRGKQVRT
jgi:hypothetical protein